MSKKDMQNSFALGLASKGVLTIDKTPILKELTNNVDKTITVKDKDGKVITMTPTYNEQGVIINLNYEGADIPVTYDAEGNITAVGDMAANLKSFGFEDSNKIDHTVKFMVDGKPYEIVSVKDGNSLDNPYNEPHKPNYFFNAWKEKGIIVNMPLLPKTDMILDAYFVTRQFETELYNYYAISKTEYPYLTIAVGKEKNSLSVAFSKTVTQTGDIVPRNSKKGGGYVIQPSDIPDFEDVEHIVDITKEKVTSVESKSDTGFHPVSYAFYTNYLLTRDNIFKQYKLN